MATSPIYSWPEPDNTDLVKNGALAIRTLGNAIDTTMATMTPKSLVDAKGDLIAATANDTPARLAVGNNGETLVADSSTSTGLRWQGSMAAGKNAIINGNFDIWQRGTSFASTSGFFADRWTNLGDLNAVTASQQTSGAPDGSRYYLRLTSTGASSYWSSYQFMETATIAPYWGKTVCFSIKLRRNATLNNSGMNIFLQKSSTVDAGSGATWTGLSSTINASLANMPTGTTSADWYLASGTVTIPNDGTCNSVRMVINYNGATASGSVVDLSQAMIEQGSVPTTFTRAGGTIQGELAACQRYYYRFTSNNSFTPFAIGVPNGASTIDTNVFFPVPMRATVASIDYSSLLVFDGVGTVSVTSVAFAGSSNSYYGARILLTLATASAILYRTYLVVANNNSAAYLGFSAEL